MTSSAKTKSTCYCSQKTIEPRHQAKAAIGNMYRKFRRGLIRDQKDTQTHAHIHTDLNTLPIY